MEEKNREDERDNDAFSSALDGILNNPEMMATIASMAQKIKGGESHSETAEEAKKESESERNASPADLSKALGALAPLLSQGFGKPSREDEERACLLRALKPYLNESRREAIEHIIKFSKISEVLKNLS